MHAQHLSAAFKTTSIQSPLAGDLPVKTLRAEEKGTVLSSITRLSPSPNGRPKRTNPIVSMVTAAIAESISTACPEAAASLRHSKNGCDPDSNLGESSPITISASAGAAIQRCLIHSFHGAARILPFQQNMNLCPLMTSGVFLRLCISKTSLISAGSLRMTCLFQMTKFSLCFLISFVRHL